MTRYRNAAVKQWSKGGRGMYAREIQKISWFYPSMISNFLSDLSINPLVRNMYTDIR